MPKDGPSVGAQANILKDAFVSTHVIEKGINGNKNILILTSSIFVSTRHCKHMISIHKMLMKYLLPRKMRFKDVRELVHKETPDLPHPLST